MYIVISYQLLYRRFISQLSSFFSESEPTQYDDLQSRRPFFGWYKVPIEWLDNGNNEWQHCVGSAYCDWLLLMNILWEVLYTLLLAQPIWKEQAPAITESTINLSMYPWWHHGMGTLSALHALCDGKPPVTGGFPLQGISYPKLSYFTLHLMKIKMSSDTI